MDYSRWSDIHQQQQQQHHLPHHPSTTSNEPYPSQYYNAQPYNSYPYQTTPAETTTPSQKHPSTGYSNPSTHYDLGHSDASLRPPGLDPYGTAGIGGHSSYAPAVGHEQMGSSVPAVGYFQETHQQGWGVKDTIRHYGADPVLYGAAGRPQSGMEQNQSSNPNMMAWTNRMYQGPSYPWKKGLKKTKVVQSVHCEVCNLDCNSKDVYDKHKTGRKHKRNVENLQGGAQNQMKGAAISTQSKPKMNLAGGKKDGISGGTGQAGAMPISYGKRKMTVGSAVPEDLEMKRMKLVKGGAAPDALKFCVLCNVACNNQTVYDYHLAGRKHAAQLKKPAPRAGIGFGAPRVNPMTWNSQIFNPASVNGAPMKRVKKTKVSQPVRCLTCNIECNNQEMLAKHEVGKKHKSNLQKLIEPVQNQKKEVTPAVGGGGLANASSAQAKPKNNLTEKEGKENPAVAGGLLANASSPQAKAKNNLTEKGGTDNGSANGLGKQEGEKKAAVAVGAAVEEDLDVKKRKLVEGGAKEAELKVCALCNLVCNSQTVLDIHLTGKKHAAQVKKQAELPGADAPLTFSSA